jgi:hypothetical protein
VITITQKEFTNEEFDACLAKLVKKDKKVLEAPARRYMEGGEVNMVKRKPELFDFDGNYITEEKKHILPNNGDVWYGTV